MNPTTWNQATVCIYIINISSAVVMQNRCRLRRSSTVATMHTSVKECAISNPHPACLFSQTQILLEKWTGECVCLGHRVFFLWVGVCLCVAYFLKQSARLCVFFFKKLCPAHTYIHTHTLCAAHSHNTSPIIFSVYSFFWSIWSCHAADKCAGGNYT